MGAITFRKPVDIKRIAVDLGHGWAKVRGLAIRPTKSARLKLRVARVDRTIPSMRREKDLMS